MSTRDIRTSHETTVCDLCGRTLLRGERADTYLDGVARHSVCELCKTRAMHEGWVREGALADHGSAPAGRRRRGSLLGRLLGRGEGFPKAPRRRSEAEPGEADPDAPEGHADGGDERGAEGRGGRRRGGGGIVLRPLSQTVNGSGGTPGERPAHRVHAVPTGDASKLAAAVALFNRSEHCRTVAGVARSLGAPGVCVLSAAGHTGLVRLVVAWELCWYRYETDLSDDDGEVRLCARGYELSELAPAEQVPNAHADERGRLHLDSLQ